MPSEALVNDGRAVTPNGNDVLPWNLAKITKMMIAHLGLNGTKFFELLKEGHDNSILDKTSFDTFLRLSKFPETGIAIRAGKTIADPSTAFFSSSFLPPLVQKLKGFIDDMEEGEKKTDMLSCKFYCLNEAI